MKITICASIAFIDDMVRVKGELEELGHEVKMPPTHIKNDKGEEMPVSEYYRFRKEEAGDDDAWVWDLKEKAMHWHFDKVAWSDAVLILNYDKKGIEGYVGGNTLLEMGVAMHLKKPIYLLNQIPEIDYKEEILGMKPVMIEGDLNRI